MNDHPTESATEADQLAACVNALLAIIARSEFLNRYLLQPADRAVIDQARELAGRPATGARISHERLEHFVAELTKQRDEASADAEKFADSPVVARGYNERVKAFRLALAFLNVWSDGVYGATYAQQKAQVAR